MYNYLKDVETINDDKIEEALTNYIEYHNNSIKSSTKFIPNEIRDIDNPDLIEKIISNIIKSLAYHIIRKNILLEKNDKLLLFDNICLKNSVYVKKDKAIGNYFYPVIFDGYINNSDIKYNF